MSILDKKPLVNPFNVAIISTAELQSQRQILHHNPPRFKYTCRITSLTDEEHEAEHVEILNPHSVLIQRTNFTLQLWEMCRMSLASYEPFKISIEYGGIYESFERLSS